MSQAPIHSYLERHRSLLKDLKYLWTILPILLYILSHYALNWFGSGGQTLVHVQPAPIGNCWFSSWKPRWSMEEAATTTSCRWPIRYVGHSNQHSQCVLVQHYHHSDHHIILPSFGNIFGMFSLANMWSSCWICYGVGLPQTHCFQHTAGRPCDFGCWPAPQFLPKARQSSWCFLRSGTVPIYNPCINSCAIDPSHSCWRALSIFHSAELHHFLPTMNTLSKLVAFTQFL